MRRREAGHSAFSKTERPCWKVQGAPFLARLLREKWGCCFLQPWGISIGIKPTRELSLVSRGSQKPHFSQRTREMGHPHWISGEAPEAGNPPDHGVTFIVAALLVMLPMDAVMVTVPPVVMPDTMETVPADTVARFVLLEFHVATCVTSGDPLQVVAVAVIEKVGWLVVTDPLVGPIVIALMQPTVTVTVCVPLSEGF